MIWSWHYFKQSDPDPNAVSGCVQELLSFNTAQSWQGQLFLILTFFQSAPDWKKNLLAYGMK
jgi:hypothetical protein